MIKKNELLPYCPAELVAKHANDYYQVDRCQDIFQFGIVVFFCLFGRLPWQVNYLKLYVNGFERANELHIILRSKVNK